MATKTVEKQKSMLTTEHNQQLPTMAFESAGDTPFGELIEELVKSPLSKEVAHIKRELHTEIDGKKVCIPITLPPREIDADMWYPAKKFRVTQTRFDEMDFSPVDSWVFEYFRDENGTVVRDEKGIVIRSYFWTTPSFESLREDEEMTYGPKELVSGQQIIDRAEARKLLGMFGNYSRRRVEDDTDTVEV